MPRDGSGGYQAPQNSWNPAINGGQALPDDWQAIRDDFVAAIQASIAADGQTPITGILNFSNNRIRNVGAPIGSGDVLRWEQMIKGPDIPSATTIAVPVEGSLFKVTGTTAITTIEDRFPGRTAYLVFDGAVTLTHSSSLILPSGVTATTTAGDVLCLVNTASGVWTVVSWPRFSSAGYPSATEPTITWPHMTWADTGNSLLKRRNAANTAWMTIGPLLSYGSSALTFPVAPSTDPTHAVAQSQVFGVNQTRQDVTASRAKSTNFTNSTGKPIWIRIIGASSMAGEIIGIRINSDYKAVMHSTAAAQLMLAATIILPGEVYEYIASTGVTGLAYEEIRL